MPTPRRFARGSTAPTLAGLALAVAIPLAGGACTGQLNQATGVRGADLPDLSPEPPALPEMMVDLDSAILPQDLPQDLRDGRWTPMPIDRTGWPTVVVLVPRGQVEVNPTPQFRDRLMPGRDSSSRSLPTPGQAVSTCTDDGRVALSGVADPFRSAWSLVESPVGLVVHPPWQVVIEPSGPVEMLPPRGDAPLGVRRIEMPDPDAAAEP